MQCLCKQWGGVDKMWSKFIFCDHVVNSDHHSVVQSIDITWRYLTFKYLTKKDCLNSNFIALKMILLTELCFNMEWNANEHIIESMVMANKHDSLAKWNRENLFSIHLQHPFIMKSLKYNCWKICFGKGLQGLLKIMLCNISCWSNFRAFKDWEANIATQLVPLHYLLIRLYFHR